MRVEKNIKDLYNYIHRGKEINFPSLVKFAREVNKRMSIIQLDQLFRHFDRNEKESINYNVFLSVMKERPGSGLGYKPP